MERKIMKNAMLLAGVMGMIFGCFPLHTMAESLDTSVKSVTEMDEGIIAQTQLQVSFDQEYAAAGEMLSVTATGGTNITYAWYVDGVQINNTTNAYKLTESDLGNWIEVVVKSDTETSSVKMYCSNLPVIYIDTEGGQAITSKETYIDANLKIQGNEIFNSETTKLYDGLTEIRGRGNTTWTKPKKPYRLKLDKKTDVFGMGKSKHWVLLANYLDESLMRNTYAYDLSGSMGMEQMSTVWVDVVLNGDYVGNYQFCENIRADETRVKVFDWESFCEDSAAVIAEAEGMDEDTAGDLEAYMAEESMQWITSGSVTFENHTYLISDYPDIKVPDINGGYILELDEYYDEVSKFRTKSNQPIMFKNPEFVYTNTDMMNYVKMYVQAFENAVQSSDYTAQYEGETTHYSELYDLDALVDYWLVSEIFFQEELNKKSTYMYKEIDEPMKMGPIWDMDWSSGGEGDTQHTNKWATLHFSAKAQQYSWYKNLVKDPYFFIKAQERYWEIRYDQIQAMLDRFDADVEYLKISAAANGERWGYGNSYEYYANHFDTWMNNHVEWLDEQMTSENLLDSSFYNANSNLALTLTDTAGSPLKGDIALRASANYSVLTGSDVKLSVVGNGISGTANIFVNGIKYGQVDVSSYASNITIPDTLLTAEPGEKNVIEVKVLNTSGSVTAANYVTVKEKAAIEESGVDKEALETIIFEAAEKVESHYSKESWKVFEHAYANAYLVALKTNATQEEVDNAASALETAMDALIEQLEPSDGSKDYETSKITYSAGSEQSTEPIYYAFDKNESTFWHTQYSPHPGWYGTEEAYGYYWVLFELEEATGIDAVRYLSRGGNGDITGYRVEGSLDGEHWEELTQGKWTSGSSEWKVAEFTPTKLKYVRLWATSTSSSNGNNRHMSARELCLRTAEVKPEKIVLSIEKQPQNVTVGYGENAEVFVEATGNNLTYTWYYKSPKANKFYQSGTDFVDGGTYRIPMYAYRDGQQVYCVITDGDGDSVQTETVTLSMRKSIEIITQPQNAIVDMVGDYAEITVEATGEHLSYAWYFKNLGKTKFYLSGEEYMNQNIYRIPVTAYRDGQQVYCVITDASGASVQTNTVNISVKKTGIRVIKDITDIIVKNAGDTAVLTVEAEGSGLTYTWFYKNPGNGKFYQSSSAFANGNIYKIPVTAYRDGQEVYCMITNEQGDCVYTLTAVLAIEKY